MFPLTRVPFWYLVPFFSLFFFFFFSEPQPIEKTNQLESLPASRLSKASGSNPLAGWQESALHSKLLGSSSPRLQALDAGKFAHRTTKPASSGISALGALFWLPWLIGRVSHDKSHWPFGEHHGSQLKSSNRSPEGNSRGKQTSICQQTFRSAIPNSSMRFVFARCIPSPRRPCIAARQFLQPRRNENRRRPPN